MGGIATVPADLAEEMILVPAWVGKLVEEAEAKERAERESIMDHTTYLERHHELTNAGLSTLAQLHAREDFEAASAYLTELRAQTAALWEERVGDAQRGVKA